MLLKLIKPVVTSRLLIITILIVLLLITVAGGALYAMLYDVYTSPSKTVELNLVAKMVNSFDKNCSTEFISDEGEEYLIGSTCAEGKIKVFSLPKEDVDVYYKFILQE